MTGRRQGALWVRRVAVTRFRNYAAGEVLSDARPVVLTGPNGAGKTNLLEAVSLLAPGRGLRRARLGEIERNGVPPTVVPQDSGDPQDPSEPRDRGDSPDGGWAVAAEVMTPLGLREIGTGLVVASTVQGGRKRERRQVRIDGVAVRGQQPLAEALSVVWLTPQMDGLFRDAASGRRRFLDRLVYSFDPAHAGRMNAYENALRQRGRLLKSGATDANWIAALEDSMARHGVAVAAARRELVGRLDKAVTSGVSAFPVAELRMACEVESWLADRSALAAEDEFKARLAMARKRDSAVGGASDGVHRSDLEVRHGERDQAAALCSTGEQKALLISILLAHARLLTLERGAPPLLLLDEVAAHLDAQRRQALFDEILALGAQAWMTGTDLKVFAELAQAAQYFAIEEAQIVRSEALDA